MLPSNRRSNWPPTNRSSKPLTCRSRRRSIPSRRHRRRSRLRRRPTRRHPRPRPLAAQAASTQRPLQRRVPPRFAVARLPTPAGDYRDVYRKAIEAKNRKQWAIAVDLFRASLALRGTDTGERINISGFGNIEPYVPHYYLGLALYNVKNCAEAVENFNMSEKDGAIQKTNLYLEPAADEERLPEEELSTGNR